MKKYNKIKELFGSFTAYDFVVLINASWVCDPILCNYLLKMHFALLSTLVYHPTNSSGRFLVQIPTVGQ